MKIVHVVTHGGWAGSEKIAFALANRQAADGWDVSIVLRESRELSNSLIEAQLAPSIQKFWVPESATRPDLQLPILKRHPQFQRLTSAQVIHAHLPYGCLLGGLLSPSGNALICATQHVRFHHYYHHCDVLFIVADWQKQDVPLSFHGEIIDAPNFLIEIPDPRIEKKVTAMVQRRAHLKGGELVMTVVGRLELIKGVDIAVRAFKKLDHPDARLIIIGDGREKDALLKLATDPRIQILGRIDHASAFYDATDIAIFPSRFESFGLSLLEAIHRERAVLASRIPAYEEMLADQPQSLFEPENVQDLARAMQDSVARLEHYRTRRKQIARYDLEQTHRQLQHAYSESWQRKQVQKVMSHAT